jgi:hypothetical protein
MIESLRNLKTSEIELRQPLPVLECEWLVGRLLAKKGVKDAKWAGGTRRLLVEYDADRFGSAELIAFLQSCGVPVAAVRAAFQLKLERAR